MNVNPMIPFKGFNGKGKGRPGSIQQDPHADALNAQVLDRLLLAISALIDSHNGVYTISGISKDRAIMQELAQIPKGFPNSVAQILPKYPDFFIMLGNDKVGTALGYDSGLIREDGTLDESAANTGTDSITMQANLFKSMTELMVVGLYSQDDSAVNQAINALRVAREKCKLHNQYPTMPGASPAFAFAGRKLPKGDPAQANLSDEERQQRREWVLQKCVEALSQQPNYAMEVSKLSSVEEIRNMKKGAIGKFQAWLQEQSAYFSLSPDADGRYVVTLIAEPQPKRARVN